MSDLYSAMYNPDVLTCLANLSSDEVFTPPEVANKMLDTHQNGADSTSRSSICPRNPP